MPRTPQRQPSIPPQYPGLGHGVQPSQGHSMPQQQPQQLRQPSAPPPAPIPPVQPKSMQEPMGGLGGAGGLKMSALPGVAPEVRASAPPARIPSATPVPPAAAAVATPAAPSAPSVVPQLPPLPANVTLNPVVTRVSVVPLVNSLKTIPGLNKEEIADIQGWMKVDKEYEGVFRKMKERMGEEAREAFGPGSVAWWEKGALDVNPNRWRRGREPFDVRYPKHRKDRDGRERRKPGRREGLRL